MGKASRTKVDATRREKIAAQQAAARRAEQRRRLLIGSGSILVVLVIVVVFVIVKLNSGSSSSSGASNGPTGSALTAVVDKVTSVPTSALDAVGAGLYGQGTGTAKIQPVQGNAAPLTANGKPEFLYIGAEYCPFCAAERWSMIVALSRFGTFSGLRTVHSSSTDIYPNTPTWTFYQSSYTSQYLDFTSVEETTNIPSGSGYTTLQTPTSAEQALLSKYDVPPYVSPQAAGSIPFMDFGNKYLNLGADYVPGVLAKLSWSTIANDLSNPNSAVAQSIDGTANYITAAICGMTGNAPASACTATVQGLETKI
jgi:hypothetical protein